MADDKKYLLENRRSGMDCAVGFDYWVIFAYAAFLHESINKPFATLLETGLALLLLGGSIFVVLVIKWSNDSIHELHAVAEREKHNAVYDAFTGLPNRKFCFEQIDNRIQ